MPSHLKYFQCQTSPSNIAKMKSLFLVSGTAVSLKFSHVTWPSWYLIAVTWWNVTQRRDVKRCPRGTLTMLLNRKWLSWHHGCTKRARKLVSYGKQQQTWSYRTAKWLRTMRVSHCFHDMRTIWSTTLGLGQGHCPGDFSAFCSNIWQGSFS